MTDNITIDNGGLADFETSTDYATSGHIQRVKLTYSADGSDTHIPADADGLLVNTGASVTATGGTLEGLGVALIDGDGDQVTFAQARVVSATPTLDTSAYAAGDCLDTTVLSWTNAAAIAAGAGHILRMTVIDDADQGIDLTVHFFEAAVTPAAENAVHALTDADAGQYIGSISTSSGTWQDHVNNQTVTITPAPPLPFKLDSGTTLYGIAVTEGAPTYAADSLEIKLQITPD